MSQLDLPDGVKVLGPVDDAGAQILSREACEFVADLVRTFRDRVHERLKAREARRGQKLDFLAETMKRDRSLLLGRRPTKTQR